MDKLLKKVKATSFDVFDLFLKKGISSAEGLTVLIHCLILATVELGLSKKMVHESVKEGLDIAFKCKQKEKENE